jgi:hypothetical protein
MSRVFYASPHNDTIIKLLLNSGIQPLLIDEDKKEWQYNLGDFKLRSTSSFGYIDRIMIVKRIMIGNEEGWTVVYIYRNTGWFRQVDLPQTLDFGNFTILDAVDEEKDG